MGLVCFVSSSPRYRLRENGDFNHTSESCTACPAQSISAQLRYIICENLRHRNEKPEKYLVSTHEELIQMFGTTQASMPR